MNSTSHSIITRERFDILGQAAEHVDRRGVMVADVEYGHNRTRPELADAMLVCEAVKSAGRAHLDAERTGNARELRDHSRAFAPEHESALLVSLAAEPQLVRPASHAVEKMVDALEEEGLI